MAEMPLKALAEAGSFDEQTYDPSRPQMSDGRYLIAPRRVGSGGRPRSKEPRPSRPSVDQAVGLTGARFWGGREGQAFRPFARREGRAPLVFGALAVLPVGGVDRSR